ncbi:MAG: CvpA family protein [Mediterranea sp.]|jgi:membrane protein required for colicin V production|nr:CvpA family protein [Mediterranea sp.]
MAILDIIILILLCIGLVRGAWKGFVRQLAGILGFIVGLIAAKMLYVYVAEHYFVQLTNSMTMAQILSFVLIWIAVPLLFALIAALLTRALEAMALGGLNRLLGAVLGVLKYLLFVCVLIGILEYLDPKNEWVSTDVKKESKLYYPLKSVVDLYFPTTTR